MSGFHLRVQDGKNGIWKTISRSNPIPVEVRSLDEVISVNDSVTDAANRNERDIQLAARDIVTATKEAQVATVEALDRLGDRNEAALKALGNRICTEVWWAAHAQSTRIREQALAIIYSAIGLGVLGTLLVLILILSR